MVDHALGSATPNSKASAFRWIIGGLASAALLVVSIVLIRMMPAEPLAEAVFPDGVRVRILKVELAESAAILGVTRWAKLLQSIGVMPLNTKSATDNLPPWTVKVERGSKGFERGEVRSTIGPALMVTYRIVAASGEPRPLALSGSPSKVELAHERGSIPGDEPIIVEAGAVHGLAFFVEDGVGGWRSMDGPVAWPDAPGQGIAMSPVFPRRSAMLKCRIARAGFALTEASFPNPGYAASFPVFKPASLPSTRKHPGIAITLFPVAVRENGLPVAIVSLASPGIPPEAWKRRVMIHDETGNCYLADDRWRGAPILPGEKHLRATCEVERNAAEFPFALGDVTILAEGKLPVADGLPTAVLTKDAVSLGFEVPSFEVVAPGATSSVSGKPEVLKFNIVSDPNAAQLLVLESSYERKQIVVFTDGVTAAGYAYRAGGSWSERFGKTTKLFSKIAWAGSVAPGGTFKIALVKKRPPIVEEFFFTLP